MRLHLNGEGHVGKAGAALEGAFQLVEIHREIVRHVALGRFDGLQHQRHGAGLLPHLDDVAVAHPVGGDVEPPPVHPHMAVVHELARGEDGRHEFHPVNDGVEAALQQLDQVLAGVAPPAHRLVVEAAELLFGDVAVMALELLLGAQLQAEIGGLAPALAVLARPVFPPVIGALGPPPEIDAEAPVDLVFRALAFCHGFLPLAFAFLVVPIGPGAKAGTGRSARILGNGRPYTAAAANVKFRAQETPPPLAGEAGWGPASAAAEAGGNRAQKKRAARKRPARQSR